MASARTTAILGAAATIGLPLVVWPVTFAAIMRVPEYIANIKTHPVRSALTATLSVALPLSAGWAAKTLMASPPGFLTQASLSCTLLRWVAGGTLASWAWMGLTMRHMDRDPPVPPYAPVAGGGGVDPEGKVALVTGATSGIGRASVIALASAGMRVVFTSRSEARGKALAEEAGENAACVVLDPNSLGDVDVLGKAVQAATEGKASAEEKALLGEDSAGWLEEAGGVAVVVCNAGMFPRPGREPVMTENGLEPAFQVMHLSHHLLVERVTRAIKAVDGRVINVASEGHKMASPVDAANPETIFDPSRIAAPTSSGFLSYGHAKLANILHARYLAASGMQAYAMHPGAVATGIWTFPYALGFLGSTWRKIQRAVFDTAANVIMKTSAQGSHTIVYLALAPQSSISSSLYWSNLIPSDPFSSPHAQSESLAAYLSTLSTDLITERLQ